ncbi:adenylate/guanylate cyclase domain-containing protein [Leptospira sp. GIMC2001]|uniref:adenylate/guanylate cyclase domain-containing protein n=1 Tax=Leptospira sp. GIMC2001 TaxID=1513297 RepID=UPI0023494459|nr:adenylate/guanylate cyclase domain-containing protein [Leptospira sp. GIMC2001]WCL50049.1 PAS domain S-box protein [Leptospira sp. GIMC2001]
MEPTKAGINLKSLAEQYKYAIDVATIVSKTDTKGRITYVNDEFCNISGYTKDELMGKPHNIVRHRDMPASAFKNFWDTIRAKRSWTGVIKNRKKNGDPYWVNTTVVPILDSDENIHEYIAIRSNITQIEEQKIQIENLHKASKKFVPETMLALQGIQDITKLNVNLGKSLELSVLFIDIIGFTTWSEKKNPEEIFSELNEYFSFMERSIHENHGVIDKYIGDNIMVIFQDPTDAIRAGIRMLEILNELNDVRKMRSQGDLKIGIGIHTGHLVLGTVGTESRMNPTVIGDTVNTASRIERLTRKVKHSLLVSEKTIHLAGIENFNAESIGRIVLKGKKEPLRIFGVYSERR